MELSELYQDLIIDHGTQPRNCCALPTANHEAQGFNVLCGDQIHVFLQIENEQIQEARFTGSGCAICMASASLMTEALGGQSIAKAYGLYQSFKALLCGQPSPPASETDLGKLKALSGVKAFPSRVKCATLPWHTLEAALQKQVTPVSTETED